MRNNIRVFLLLISSWGLISCGGGSAANSSGSGGANNPTNNAPTVSNISISSSSSAQITLGNPLVGEYAYDDAEGDTEGASIYRWLRNGTAISEANSKNYTVSLLDVGSQLIFEVTPIAVAVSTPPPPPMSSGNIGDSTACSEG